MPLPGTSAARSAWRRVVDDSLYRNSFWMMLNTVVGAGLGAAFLAVATRRFTTDEVGVLTTSVSTSLLLGTIATLGLPNALVRFLPTRPDRTATMASTALVLSALSATVVFAASFVFPHSMPLARRGQPAGLVLVALAIVVVLALNMVVDSAFIATRRAHVLVTKNTVGGLVKVASLFVLPEGGITRLALAHLLGTGVSAAVALAATRGALQGPWLPGRHSLDGIWSFSIANYFGVIAGILPTAATPLIVHDMLGPGESAVFYICLMLLSLVNVVPQTISLSFFAELSNTSGTSSRRLVDAGGALYGLLVPVLVVTLPLAPYLLRVFGNGYAVDGTACLRWMVAGVLATAVNYVVDALVNGRGDGAGYLMLNVVNAALVLGGVALGARVSLTGVGIGWVLAQAISGVIGVVYAAARRPRRDPEPAVALMAAE